MSKSRTPPAPTTTVAPLPPPASTPPTLAPGADPAAVAAMIVPRIRPDDAIGVLRRYQQMAGCPAYGKWSQEFREAVATRQMELINTPSFATAVVDWSLNECGKLGVPTAYTLSKTIAAKAGEAAIVEVLTKSYPKKGS